jgi:hypothetical protein
MGTFVRCADILEQPPTEESDQEKGTENVKMKVIHARELLWVGLMCLLRIALDRAEDDYGLVLSHAEKALPAEHVEELLPLLAWTPSLSMSEASFSSGAIFEVGNFVLTRTAGDK